MTATGMPFIFRGKKVEAEAITFNGRQVLRVKPVPFKWSPK